MDWAQALDFERAHNNLRDDFVGDWYHDPWGWPELRWVVENEPALISSRLNASGTMRCLHIDVPKANYIIRPAVLLDGLDRLIYQAIVDQLSIQLIGGLPSFVYAWRLGRLDPEPGRYLPNSIEWTKFRNRLRWLSIVFDSGLTTDITSFFASISVSMLVEEISQIQRPNRVTARLANLLQGWERTNRRGIPQRCMASSALANFFLGPIDDLLARRTRARTAATRQIGSGVCRWMDDIWIFAGREAQLRSIQLALSQRLEQRGLRVNAAKTSIYEDEKLVAKATEMELGYVDVAIVKETDFAPLERLLEEVLARPTTTPRTKIRFLLGRIGRHDRWDLLAGLTAEPERMPHVADSLARAFHERGVWRDLQDWYMSYARSGWGEVEWGRYQFCRMFPSDEAPERFLIEYLASEMEELNLPAFMVPLVAQRLARWDKLLAREVFRSAAPKAGHPFQLRALAFAGLAAGVNSTEVRTWLDQFPETEIVSRYLIDRDWRPPRAVADFS